MERKILRFQIGLEKANTSWHSSAVFEHCRVLQQRGISGLTQYEDMVRFHVDNPNVLYLPAFIAMHYFQFEVILEYNEDSFLRLSDGEDELRISIASIGPERIDCRVNDRFAVDLFEYVEQPVGRLTVLPQSVTAGERCTMAITYRPEQAIQTGGKIRILSPFSCWGNPGGMLGDRVSTDSATAKLKVTQAPYPMSIRGVMYEITVRAGELLPGERVELLHTDLHTRGIAAQPYIQDKVYFLAWEDCDGRGVWNSLPLNRCGRFSVVAGTAVKLRLAAQQMSRAGEELTVRLRALDRMNNPVSTDGTTVEVLVEQMEGKRLHRTSCRLRDGQGSCVVLLPDEPGIYRLSASAPGMEVTHLPLCVTEYDESSLYFGALHGHSEISDGTFSMEHYFQYGRDAGLLDFCALTDHDWEQLEHSRNHDHVGMKALCRLCDEMNAPGRYVTIPAYEWMGDEGHMNLYFRGSSDTPICSGNVTLFHNHPTYPTAKSLLDQYRGREDVLILPHLSHGFDWNVYDPALQTAAEIYSQWGYSEYMCACRAEKPGAVHWLQEGLRFGFLGGADAHHGMPGQTGYLSKYVTLGFREGYTALYADALTRESVFDAMKARHTYATTGERMFLSVTMCHKGYAIRMGDAVQLPEEADTIRLAIRAGGTKPLTAVRICTPERILYELCPEGESYCGEVELPRVCAAHECYYVKLIQSDGEMAWSSPIWIDTEK